MRMIKEKNIFALLCFMVFSLPVIASAHLESHDLPDAVSETEYKIAIDLKPDDIESRNKLGNFYYRSGRLKEAAEQFNYVLRLKPDDYAAHYGMGLVEIRQGRYKEAVIRLKKAVALNKEEAIVYYHLGIAYKLMGRYEKAVLELRKAADLKHIPDVITELRKLEKLLDKKR
jgi:Flp pilus assembly protein TadD